jgi:hypothetical protein
MWSRIVTYYPLLLFPPIVLPVEPILELPEHYEEVDIPEEFAKEISLE